MSKKKANIRPDLIHEIYIDGGRIYRLESCEIEPHATMKPIGGDEAPITKPISEFSNFVQLKPVSPIEKPKKQRADLGKTHKKQASTPSDVPAVPKKRRSEAKHTQKDEVLEIADIKDDLLIIHVPTGIGDDTDYFVNIAGSMASGPESVGLRVVVLAALEAFGDKIPDELTEQERRTVQGILDAGE